MPLVILVVIAHYYNYTLMVVLSNSSLSVSKFTSCNDLIVLWTVIQLRTCTVNSSYYISIGWVVSFQLANFGQISIYTQSINNYYCFFFIQDNPQLPRLFMTGVFFFILMYTGSNILPIADFLKYTHMKQSFRPDEVFVCLFVCLFVATVTA